jgi:N-hydroxyarylamine O-acetyltransferase
MNSTQLTRYLARIDHPAAEAAPATLSSLAAAHARSIPFENLDAFVRRRVSLELAAVFDKLVLGCRGGWCFEQNLLFGEALRALGFDVTDLAARVLWGRGPDAITPRTHRALLVRAEGRDWLLDVGFGGQSICGAIDLSRDDPQQVGHDVFRLEPLAAGERRLWVRIRGQWQPMYRFDLQPQLPVDFEAANFQLCMDPASHFTQMLMLSRATPDGRHVLRDFELGFHDPNGATTRRVLRGPEEVLGVMEEFFGLKLDEEMRQAVSRKLSQRVQAG